MSRQIEARGVAGPSPFGEEHMVRWRVVWGCVLGGELLVRGRHWGLSGSGPQAGVPSCAEPDAQGPGCIDGSRGGCLRRGPEAAIGWCAPHLRAQRTLRG